MERIVCCLRPRHGSSVSDFVLVSNNQNVKVWNSETSPPSRDQKASKYKLELGYVAAGTSRGTVILWKLNTLEVVHVLGSVGEVAHKGQVNAIAFNSSGTSLFSAGEDGQIMEWSVAAGKLTQAWTPSRLPISALALSSSDKELLIADTVIRLWNLEMNCVTATFTNHTSPVTSLHFAQDGRTFASADSQDRVVNVWQIPPRELTDGNVESLVNGVGEMPQSTSEPVAWVSIDGGAVFVTLSAVGDDEGDAEKKGTHTVDAVDSTTSAKGRKKNETAKKKKTAAESATAASSADSSSSAVSAAIGIRKRCFHLGTISVNGTAAIWQIEASGRGALPYTTTTPLTLLQVEGIGYNNRDIAVRTAFDTARQKKSRIETKSTNKVFEEGSIIALWLQPSSQSDSSSSVTIARYSATVPEIQSIKYGTRWPASTNGEIAYESRLIFPALKRSLLNNAESRKRKDRDEIGTTPSSSTASVIGASNVNLASISNAMDEYESSIVTHPTASSLALGDSTPSLVVMRSSNDGLLESEDGPRSGDAQGHEGLLTMHEKRAKLLQRTGELTRSLAARIAEADRKNALAVGTKLIIPTSGSLQTALSQALHAKDDKLLEECLSMGSKGKNSIHATVSKLAAQQAVPLLTELIVKLQRNPNRGVHLVPWIRETLHVHASFLLTVPSVSKSLSVLHEIIEKRLIPFKKFLSLQGRLDLLMSQVNRSTNLFDRAHGPTVVFEESKLAEVAAGGDNEADMRQQPSASDSESEGLSNDQEEENLGSESDD